ncbi:MAG TPA: recombinase RecA [Planctomycetaceae bacterium]|nr:recombinase RecA [Planctomycetaceae bacterium]
MSDTNRLTTGIAELDEILGGGLIPGTLTVVVGATGVGKTHFGLHFAYAGRQQEGEPGVIYDMTSRGDSQNHVSYAQRLFGWSLRVASPDGPVHADSVWDRDTARFDYVHIFRRSGRRVTKGDLDEQEWRQWKSELARKLHGTIAFFYGSFIHGVRRCVIDGVEPTAVASDSFQLTQFEYIYHQILRKDADWVARDLFREGFRANAERVRRYAYDARSIGCLLLCTTHEVMLDDLIAKPLQTGDVLVNANTVILMGKVRDGSRMGRALYVAKHRGSPCDDRIIPFEIGEAGLRLRLEK